MTEATIFDSNTQESNIPPTTIPTLPTEVLDLVGVGKKYSTVDDALKSVPHAQKHIQNLEAELAQTKEDLAARRTTQELLDEMKSGIQQGNTPPVVEFDQDRVVQIATQLIKQEKKQAELDANIDVVIHAFDAHFGEKGKEMYMKLAEESGLPVSALNHLAATSPTAVLKLAGLSKKEVPVPGKTQGSVNTETFQGTNTATLSARVGKSTSTKDLVAAWKIAGEKVKQQLG